MGRLQGRWLCRNVGVMTWKRLSENMIAYEVHVQFWCEKTHYSFKTGQAHIALSHTTS
jgi:hypothetical protein